MKRGFQSCTDDDYPEALSKKQHIGISSPETIASQRLGANMSLKRGFDDNNYFSMKKQRCGDDTRLPENIVRYLAFGQKCVDLPDTAIRQIKEEAEHQLESSRSNALTIYRGPVTEEADDSDEDEDIGPISYYLPTFRSSSQNADDGRMEEETPLNYQDQMRMTGMMGVPPPPSDDGLWPM